MNQYKTLEKVTWNKNYACSNYAGLSKFNINATLNKKDTRYVYMQHRKLNKFMHAVTIINDTNIDSKDKLQTALNLLARINILDLKCIQKPVLLLQLEKIFNALKKLYVDFWKLKESKILHDMRLLNKLDKLLEVIEDKIIFIVTNNQFNKLYQILLDDD